MRPPFASESQRYVGSGREELRAALLKPYLLRLREERGEAAVKALLSSVGIPPALLDSDAGWLTVAAARRALAELAIALGEGSLGSWGPWMTHPETLGAYVRMLRVASQPVDAYRFLAANSAERTRIGSYELLSSASEHVVVAYKPRPDADVQEPDELLCFLRRAELVSLPRIWGLGDARIAHPECVAKGAAQCRYELSWATPKHRGIALGALIGAGVSGLAIGVSGSLLAAAIGGILGAAFGATVASLERRVSEERALRTFERHRIAALERGLEVRGEFGELAPDLVGATLGGKYRITSRIGSGGIGAVYAAEHLGLGANVAIKVLRGAAAADASEVARLRREARVQVSIEHPNVVRTLDLDQLADGSIYVVMELLQGESLGTRLRRRGPLSPAGAVPIFMQVCRALAAAHQQGVVHRDLKPANIFLCTDGVVKVLDFGMSKLSEAESLTQDGYTLGTPEYMSPEQCIGAPVDPRTDLYSFGVLMYEALTGDLPIRGRSRRELLDLHQREIPMGLRHARPDLPIPAELETAVMTCLRKRGAERPQNARELEKLLEQVPVAGLPQEYPQNVPRRLREA